MWDEVPAKENARHDLLRQNARSLSPSRKREIKLKEHAHYQRYLMPAGA